MLSENVRDKEREITKIRKTVKDMEHKISNLITNFEDFKIENEGRESRYTSNASSIIHSRKHSPENGNIANLRDMVLLQNQIENLSHQNKTLENI